MFRTSHSLAHHIGIASMAGLPLCLLLSACGGDGTTTVASMPPPPPVTPTPTPTPTAAPMPGAYPVSQVGSYDLMGRLTLNPGSGIAADWTYRNAAPGEFSMTVSQSTGSLFSYTLNASAGIFPGDTDLLNAAPAYWAIDPNGFLRSGSYQIQPFSADTNLRIGTFLDVGYSYVSMGDWQWSLVDLQGNPGGRQSGDLLFVSGDRTPASAIPISGTATYDAHTLLMRSSSGSPGIPFTLTADFGQRTISTRIDQDFNNWDDGDPMNSDPIQGIHVDGSAPFSNDGSFDIPLTGTVNYSYQNLPAPPASQAATGDMNGAFFGPNAEQVGGTFSLHRSGETVLYQDAFVGQQHHP